MTGERVVRKTMTDTDASAELCRVLGLDPVMVSELTISVTAPGRFIVEAKIWAEPDAEGIVRTLANLEVPK